MSKSKDPTKEANAVNPAYTWQNPQNKFSAPIDSRGKKIAIISGAVGLFVALSILLAFI